MASIEDALHAPDRTSAWEKSPLRDDEWRAEMDDGRLIGLVREVAGAWEGRVLRHPTGPTPGPDPEPAHGPQVFEDPREALDYVEANLGLR